MRSRAAKRKSGSAAQPGRRPRTRHGAAPRLRPAIDLYYWPTPNGWKVSIMLEECGLSYRMIPVNIAQGDQFRPAFLRISPNNRIPAIVDRDGPGGRPIAIFESGAILQYLGRKTAKFYPADERARVAVDQWLFWQMANLGPKAGEASHFRTYAAAKQQHYAMARFDNELHRLLGVMNQRLGDRAYLAGRYSIADIACVGWVRHAQRRGQDLSEFPHLSRWLEIVLTRPAVQRGIRLRVEAARAVDIHDPKVRAVLFGQRARPGG
jgi:GST-like protein